ncbi:MAG: hypothetical protein COW32_09945 [Candidatus Aquicultor secundus]|uniref:Uncharacterized protein n=1 Tax=Candidatus Aquicultor secundus TaxID=1973895 RepID=A0A2M7TA34_9ACTN|nr:MAG: hypothetical protein AUK32_09850 [Candidatus Aquicultor secundus]PIU27237.1 MAG: hypothetical protein COT10_04485 [Candidatus Aquicultor secundus]PIW21445.1 MAG: hypothetical protein COW32_09945 [Candidatus Aquicultor secundus]PIX51685.1 MAG: hypothetical protein COZ51_08215 [Candidatus Aquicultor secundus]PIY37139.1 MAG: hypothetical protein COZ03_10670 [Candidatus Aquicultor secundus]
MVKGKRLFCFSITLGMQAVANAIVYTDDYLLAIGVAPLQFCVKTLLIQTLSNSSKINMKQPVSCRGNKSRRRKTGKPSRFQINPRISQISQDNGWWR